MNFEGDHHEYEEEEEGEVADESQYVEEEAADDFHDAEQWEHAGYRVEDEEPEEAEDHEEQQVEEEAEEEPAVTEQEVVVTPEEAFLQGLQDLVEKGLLECGGKQHQVEENLVGPPKKRIPTDQLDLPSEFMILLSETDVWRSSVREPGHFDQPPNSDPILDTHDHKAYQFRFPSGITTAVIIHGSRLQPNSQSYDKAQLIAFGHSTNDGVQLLFQCHHGEIQGDSNLLAKTECNEEALGNLITALGLTETTHVQFVAGIFSKIFSNGDDPNNHHINFRNIDGVFGLENMELTEGALTYMKRNLEESPRKKKKTQGSSLEEPIVIDE